MECANACYAVAGGATWANPVVWDWASDSVASASGAANLTRYNPSTRAVSSAVNKLASELSVAVLQRFVAPLNGSYNIPKRSRQMRKLATTCDYNFGESLGSYPIISEGS